MSLTQWPPFPLGSPTNKAWREFALTQAAEMRALLEWFKAMPPETALRNRSGRRKGEAALPPRRRRPFRRLESVIPPLSTDQVIRGDHAIEWHLDDAIKAARLITRWYSPSNQAIIARVTSNLDAAESALLRRAPRSYLKGQIDHLLAHVQFHLPKNDPRREGMETVARSIRDGADIDDAMRETIIRAVSIASLQARREYDNVQSFRTILLWTSLVLFVGALVLGVWGAVSPADLSLCFKENPEDEVATICPIGTGVTRRDIFLIEVLGIMAAALSGGSILRHIDGRSGRFGLPLALAVLKIPVGALSAVLGLLLVRGDFIPGLSDLDSSEQILAWAVVFGAAQQLLTGLIDRQAANVVGQLESQTDKAKK
jgi:hypothetical protein